jgi:hypothetical protein
VVCHLLLYRVDAVIISEARIAEQLLSLSGPSRGRQTNGVKGVVEVAGPRSDTLLHEASIKPCGGLATVQSGHLACQDPRGRDQSMVWWVDQSYLYLKVVLYLVN